MDPTRFDRLTRSLSAVPTRRGLLAGLAALGWAAGRFPEPAAGKRNRRNKNVKKLKLNAFRCVDVGGKCRGNDGNCCSGICQGKKPKKGEKDKSTCVAHDTGGCQAGEPEDVCLDDTGFDIACTTGTGVAGVCGSTTGDAGYCFAREGATACQRDADCRAELGPRAACIICSLATGGTLCVGPDTPF